MQFSRKQTDHYIDLRCNFLLYFLRKMHLDEMHKDVCCPCPCVCFCCVHARNRFVVSLHFASLVFLLFERGEEKFWFLISITVYVVAHTVQFHSLVGNRFFFLFVLLALRKSSECVHYIIFGMCDHYRNENAFYDSSE